LGADENSSFGNAFYFIGPIVVIVIVVVALVVYFDERAALFVARLTAKISEKTVRKALNAVKIAPLQVEVNGQKQQAFLIEEFPKDYKNWQYVIGTIKGKQVEPRQDRLNGLAEETVQGASYVYDQDAELMTLVTAVYVYTFRQYMAVNRGVPIKQGKRVARRTTRKFIDACSPPTTSMVDNMFPFLNDGAESLTMGEALDRAQKPDICGADFRFNMRKVGMEGMVLSIAPKPPKGGNFWLRPDKVKILVGFAQIFNNLNKNFDNLRWPEEVSSTMNFFSGINFNLIQIGSIECIAKTSFYTSLTFMVLINIFCLLCFGAIYLVGRKRYTSWLQRHPPACPCCGEYVTEMKKPVKELAERTANTEPNASIVDDNEGGIEMPTVSNDKFATISDFEKKQKLSDLNARLKHANKFKEEQLDYFLVRHPGCEDKAPSAATQSADFYQTRLETWKKRVLIRVNFTIYKTKMWKLLYLFLFLAYVPTATIILKTLDCVDFEDDQFLDADMSVVCSRNGTWDSVYMQYAILAIIMIIFYVIGVPLFFLRTLYLTRVKGVAARWELLKTDEFEAVRDRMLKDAERRAEARGVAWREPRSLEQEHLALAKFMMETNLESVRAVSRVGFLYREYAIWWFEILETARKLFLNGVIVFIGAGKTLQILTAMFTCFVMLIVIQHVKPYKTESNNNIGAFVQLSFFLTMFLGLMVKVESMSPAFVQEIDIRAFAMFIVIINVAVVVLSILSIFWDKYMDDIESSTDDFETGISKYLVEHVGRRPSSSLSKPDKSSSGRPKLEKQVSLVQKEPESAQV
jgi:hypothetical protein